MSFDAERPPGAELPASDRRVQPDAHDASSRSSDSARRSLAGLRFGVFRRLASGSPFPRGLPTKGARPIEAMRLGEALSRRWDDDRHFVTYVSDRPYRINNAALGEVQVEARILALDVDNHADAPGWMEAERPRIARLLEAHPGAFVHTTRRGWRALYAWSLPFPIRSEADKETYARHYARVAGYLFERFGVAADAALTRWNQPIRLPHVVRDGHVFDAEILGGDPHALGALVLPVDVPEKPELRRLAELLPAWGAVARRWEPRRGAVQVASAAFDHVPLPPYLERMAAADAWVRVEAPRAVQGQRGRATARSVAAILHVGFALQRDDVARLLMDSYNRRRCSPPWSEGEIEDLRGMALGVVRAPMNPWGFMLTRDRTGIEAARATLEVASSTRNVVPLEEVGSRIVRAVTEHPAVVVRASCGAGKTHAMAEYIANETSGRVVVVVPRHELGRAWVKALAAFGEPNVAYHASVVQRRDERGKRHCDNKIALKLYREGGDVARDVCPTCPRVTTCPAYAARPTPGARVHVTPREMLPALEITEEDLVVYDDAAVDLLVWHRLGVRQLRRLQSADMRLLPSGQAAYLPAFVAGLLAGPRGANEAARAALTQAGLPLPDSADLLRHVAERLMGGQRSPRLPVESIRDGGDELAETMRDVGRLRQVLRFASAYAADGDADIHWSDDARAVHGESDAARLLRSHTGQLVVLDAAAVVEELRSLRKDMHVERLDVDDAGDASRLLLFAKNANRTAVRDPRQRRALLDAWLGAVLAHLTARRARRPVFVTYKPLEEALSEHPALVAWLEADPRREARFTHYGAVRGSNRFKRRDAVVTLGDPWLNGDDVIGRASRLDLDEPSYRVALATAELGQAHGRSRSVRRRRRLTHVHVGRLVPDGWSGGAQVEPLGGPPERTRRPADRVTLSALVAALGGNRAAAEQLGCSPSTIAGWRANPRRSIPRKALARLHALVETRDHKTASSGSSARGGPAVMDAVPLKGDPTDCVHGERSCASEEAVAAGRGGGPVESDVVWPGSRDGSVSGSCPLENELPTLADASVFVDGARGRGSGSLVNENGSPLPPSSGGSPSAVESHRRALRGGVDAFEAEGPQGATWREARSPPPLESEHSLHTRQLDADELALLAEAQAQARRRVGLAG